MVHATASIHYHVRINENKNSNVQSALTNFLCYRSLFNDFSVVGLFSVLAYLPKLCRGIKAVVHYKLKMEVIFQL